MYLSFEVPLNTSCLGKGPILCLAASDALTCSRWTSCLLPCPLIDNTVASAASTATLAAASLYYFCVSHCFLLCFFTVFSVAGFYLLLLMQYNVTCLILGKNYWIFLCIFISCVRESVFTYVLYLFMYIRVSCCCGLAGACSKTTLVTFLHIYTLWLYEIHTTYGYYCFYILHMPNIWHIYMKDVCTYMKSVVSTMQWGALYTYLTYISEQIWLPHSKYSSHSLKPTWAYRPNIFENICQNTTNCNFSLTLLPNMCQKQTCPTNEA